MMQQESERKINLFIALLILLLVILVGCNGIGGVEVGNQIDDEFNKTSKNDDNINKSIDQIDIYCRDKTKTALVPFKIDKLEKWDSHSKDTKIIYLINKMKENPKGILYESSVPENVEIESARYNSIENIVNVDFGNEYLEIEPLTQILLKASLVKTLTGLDFVKGVSFSIEGKPLLNSNGIPIGPLKEEDIFLKEEEYSNKVKEREIILYFMNENATALVAEKRKVKLSNDEWIASIILQELIKGPQNKGLHKTLPETTKIKDIQVRDGICYVDFNEAFIKDHWGGSSGEFFTVSSIVNTLTELTEINKIQFLIEGEKQETFKGHIKFDELFERDRTSIQ